jgi:hypothetical protein
MVTFAHGSTPELLHPGMSKMPYCEIQQGSLP